MKLDAAAHTVFLDESHVRIGLGGIAKGYAVDKAAKVLTDAGMTSFYVQAGGDLFTHGTKPDGSPWLAGVRDPRGPDGDYFSSETAYALELYLDHLGVTETGTLALGQAIFLPAAARVTTGSAALTARMAAVPH